ncbi:CaiB/BaiF CoA transferase family protein [Dactylosporangium sp. CA-092794]|uniref:CaiB/BaiF CoA transferase family protein n=1 Tax=Dactylosporangium sp. CA-092794 TaxID=3239929 RepID=UPI003D92C1C7
MSGPLDGVRILDMSRLIAGNMLTMLLADFGAEVVKVERPRVGDTLRGWKVGGRELYWQVYGRNKKSVTLDLKSEPGRAALLRMVDTADVLVESFRPGTLNQLGLGWDVLRERRPNLVYLPISGWGQTGSLSDRPGFGTLVEAKSGFAASNGFPDREPVLPPLALADMVAGVYGAYAVTLALRHAASTGQGQLVDLSLFDALFSIMGPVAAIHEATGQVPQRSGNRSPISAPRNIYRARDGGWVALSATTQSMFERLAVAMATPELAEDPRFATNAARLAHIDALDAAIGAYFAARSTAEALGELDEAGVTACAVDDIASLVGSEFFRTRRVLTRAPDRAGEPGVLMHDVVPRLTASPGAVRSPAPRLGEHTAAVLRPLLTDEEWEKLSE